MEKEMTMVARVAKALSQQLDKDGYYVDAARAAIEAMREPTHTMGLAGIKTGLIHKAIAEGVAHWQIDYPKMIFSAMVDAALKEPD